MNTKKSKRLFQVIGSALIGVLLLITVCVVKIITCGEEARMNFIQEHFGVGTAAGFMVGVAFCLSVLFSLLIVAVLIWALISALKRMKRRDDGDPGIARVALALILGTAMAYLPSQSQAGQVVLTSQPVPIAVTQTASTSVTNAPVEIFFRQEAPPGTEVVYESPMIRSDLVQDVTLKDALNRYNETGQTNFTYDAMGPGPYVLPIILACVLKILIVVIVIAGIIYIGYLIYKACQKLDKKIKKKQQDPDDTDPPPQTNYGVAALSGPIKQFTLPPDAVVYRALFVFPAGNASDAEKTNCDCVAPFSYTFGATTTNVWLKGYVPTNLVSETDFLLSRGLSTNENVQAGQVMASYSVNGIPTNQLDVITLTSNGVFTVNWPSTTNVTLNVQSSRDLNQGNWTNVVTLSVPEGARMKGRVSPSTGEEIQFLRIR